VHPTLSHGELIRNPAIAAELDAALATGRHTALVRLLCRFSGLPGPRFNDKLAWAVGQALAARTLHGAPENARSRVEALVTELCRMSAERAPPGTDLEFLPIVGAFALAARVAVGVDPEGSLVRLRVLAEDVRYLVRDAVRRALVEAGVGDVDASTRALATWMDGYLSAAVALEVVTVRPWLDASKSSGEILARLDEAFLLAEGASRADRRSQGYRTLLKSIADASIHAMDRFRSDTLGWLESKTTTSDVDLREALAVVLHTARGRGRGKGQLSDVEQSLAASAPPRRDPKTYVGPTRKRGARGRRR
jgi:hypothetical protein